MNQAELAELIEALIREEIDSEDHDLLQTTLKVNDEARAVFRERIDMEASLRTWAEESHGPPLPVTLANSPRNHHRPTIWTLGIGGAAAMVLIIFLVGSLVWRRSTTPDSRQITQVEEPTVQLVGIMRRQQGCKWADAPPATGSRFAAGKLNLIEGMAELEFDSGVQVTLEGPCELVASDRQSAQLLAGNVFVHVTEISNGFLLETPDAQIIDEGTQFAVSLSDESTEVHVFDGAVIWSPTDGPPEAGDRIESGEARRYQRGRPAVRQHIPLDERQFVRQIEETLKQTAGDSLLAYDGFENLAGQLRRDRSGFGWSGGWQLARRGRGKLATVADAPPGVVFGINRSNRRLLILNDGNNIRREFEEPLTLVNDDIFVSFLVERFPPVMEAGGSLQISFEPEALNGRRRWKSLGSFGFTTEGFPYLNIENAVSKTAASIETEEVYFVVVRISSAGDCGANSAMRVFRPGEAIPTSLPSTWTLEGLPMETKFAAHSLRITIGQEASWQVDELKVGATWQSITTPILE